MSKILKFIVNLFLIGAILVAVAILVPPLAGITTTVVDTASMNTNLPLGSITYSTDIDVYDIQPGDEILKENDTSTYAYVIREADPASGTFKAVSATDPDGAEENVMLRNTVSKVAVVVPYIGYILIAMHSIEGIIIVVLVVVLMIILFILSELWKARPEDEEDDEENGEGREEDIPQVTAAEETDIDTEAIRAAVEENHSAAAKAETKEESPSADEEEKPDYSGMSWSEKRAAKKARRQAERSAREAEQAAGDAFEAARAEAEQAAAAAAAAAAMTKNSEAEEEARIEEALAGLAHTGQKEEREITEETEPEKAPEVQEETENGFFEEVPYTGEAAAALVKDENEVPSEAGQTLEDLARQMEERAREAGTDGGYLPTEEKEAFFADFADPEEPAPQIPSAGTGGMSADDLIHAERFAPTPRPSYEEILEEAKDGGKEPVVKKDDRSGISLVDVSGLL
jgi:hypothetical protein